MLDKPGGLCSECGNHFCKQDGPPGQMGAKICWRPIDPNISPEEAIEKSMENAVAIVEKYLKGIKDG